MTIEPAPPETFRDGSAVAEAIRGGRRRFIDVEFIGCDLSGVPWTGVSVEAGRFDHCVFGEGTMRISIAQARFQKVTFEWCDFRRCAMQACTFRSSRFEWCDFYRAEFTGGTTFEDARFAASSLSRCDLSGSDLALTNVRGTGDLSGIVQLSADSFVTFHDGFAHVDPAQQATHIAEREREAIEILRTLGGHFLARGNFVDEGVVYYVRRSLELEVLRHGASRERGIRRLLDITGLWLAKVTCGFGERLGRVVATIGVVVGVVSIALWLTGGVDDDQGERTSLDGAILTAVLQAAGRSPEHLHPAHNWAELFLAVETLVVISLAGLFGFILANRIRSR